MKTADVFRILLLVLLTGTAAATDRFEIGQNDFLYNGEVFVIRAGEMHAARIPPEYWAHRLQMAHAMGCNTVCAYLFWNLHEPSPGQFNFTGSADAARYVRLAQQEGLKVILRPGPYSCAEWDFGGFPSWLLKDPQMRLRSRYPEYLKAVRNYLLEVGKQLAPLQITRGGPIIMVQVENEYGTYGDDKEYIATIRDYLVEAGFEVPLFTCDGLSQLKNDVREDIFCVVNFGGNPEKAMDALRTIRPKGPLMCGEYYPGWFDHWGKPHHYGDVEKIISDLTYMLDRRISFSVYMVHGGTSFGFWAGANCPPFAPQTTSYDYDAPISEAGWATEKFHTLRSLFQKHLLPGETLPDIPPPLPVIEIPSFALTDTAELLQQLPEPRIDVLPQPMEMYDQFSGAILYRTNLLPGKQGVLHIKDVHDRALIFLNHQRIGTVDRLIDKNTKLEQENLYFSRELSRLKEAAEELSAMQTEIRNLNRNIPKTSQSSAHRGEGGFTFAPPAGEVFSRQEFQTGLDSLEDLLADLKREFSAIQATPLIWPVDGNITSSFGNRTNPFTRRWEFHSGIDIANAVGTPILAPAAGKVVLVERTRLAGNLLVIEHGNGTTTKYAHCHRVLVRRGDRIERGEKIALMGNTGLSTGPHLHYEVHLNGRPVNPYRFMSLKFAAAGPAAD